MATAQYANKHAAPNASFGQGAGRFPLTSPLHDIYRDWERRFNERLVAGWRRKLEVLTPALRALYPDKSLERAVKAHDDLIGLPPQFWADWENGYIEDIQPFMREGAQIGLDLAVGELESRFSVSVEPGRVDSAIAAWANQNTMWLIRENSPVFKQTITETDRKILREELAAWIETGGTFPELVERLQNSIMISHARAEMIAITEATRAYAAAQQIAWKESGVVTHNRWNTARDEVVCPICRPLDGQEVELGTSFISSEGGDVGASPPAHVRCRCWPSAVVRDIDSMIDFLTQEGAVGQAAENLLKNVNNFEGLSSEMLERLAKANGGTLRGLENKFKSKLSLMRKMNDYMDTGMSLEEAAGRVNDALRYTVEISGEDFVGNVRLIQAQLEAEGWVLYDHKAKNYFGGGDGYDGYNTVMINPATGQRFELQFHTPASYKITKRAHELYEEYRVLHENSPRAVELWAEMTEMTNMYDKPKDWQNLPGIQIGGDLFGDPETQTFQQGKDITAMLPSLHGTTGHRALIDYLEAIEDHPFIGPKSEAMGRRALLELLSLEEENRLKFNIKHLNPLFEDVDIENLRAAIDFVESITRSDAMNVNIATDLSYFLGGPKTRAGYKDGRVSVATFESAHVIVHELAHHFEFMDPQVLLNTKDFLDYRMETQFHQYSPGDFRSTYTAKTYYGADPDNLRKQLLRATEILSTGMQQLYDDPSGLARDDPEFFAFLINQIQGTDAERGLFAFDVRFAEGVDLLEEALGGLEEGDLGIDPRLNATIARFSGTATFDDLDDEMRIRDEVNDELGIWETGSARQEFAANAMEQGLMRSDMEAIGLRDEHGDLASIVSFRLHREYATILDGETISFQTYELGYLATRESGWGRAMMQELINEAAEVQEGIVLSSVSEAEGFYQALGMHQDSSVFYFTPEEVQDLAHRL